MKSYFPQTKTNQMLPEGKKYHAFISYSHKDKVYARAIQREIQKLGVQYRMFGRTDVEMYRDENKTPLVDDLTNEIKQALRNSHYLLIIASPNSAKSEWVEREIIYWKEIQYGLECELNTHCYLENINFILLNGELIWDPTSNEFDKILSTALPKYEGVIFRNEPGWADVRGFCFNGSTQIRNYDFQLQMARIKSTIFGKKEIGIDGKMDWIPTKSISDIMGDTTRDRNRTISFLGLISMMLIGLTIYALLTRADAMEQKKKAIENKIRAEKEESKAKENLIRYKKEEFNRNVRNGNIYLEAEEHCRAKKCFQEALITCTDSQYKAIFEEGQIQYLDSVLNTIKRINSICP